MTVTYDITTDIGKIRRNIGDKDISDAQFTDEELQYYLDDEGSVKAASAAALESWAAAYATNADQESIGDYSYRQDVVKKMLSLAKTYRDSEGSAAVIDIASMDLTGGSSITAEED